MSASSRLLGSITLDIEAIMPQNMPKDTPLAA